MQQQQQHHINKLSSAIWFRSQCQDQHKSETLDQRPQATCKRHRHRRHQQLQQCPQRRHRRQHPKKGPLFLQGFFCPLLQQHIQLPIRHLTVFQYRWVDSSQPVHRRILHSSMLNMRLPIRFCSILIPNKPSPLLALMVQRHRLFNKINSSRTTALIMERSSTSPSSRTSSLSYRILSLQLSKITG